MTLIVFVLLVPICDWHIGIAQAAPPVDFLFVNATPDDGYVHLVWNTVDEAVSYTVRWRALGDDSFNELIVDTGKLWYSVVSLDNGKLYQFQVVARLSDGRLIFSDLVSQTPQVRNECIIVNCSQVMLAAFMRGIVGIDPKTMKCRGVVVPWDEHTPDCVYLEDESGPYGFALLRSLGKLFAPVEVRPVFSVRTLARRAIWGAQNPYDDPATFPITITQSLSITTGNVTAFAEARSYNIQFHPQLASRVTWFIPRYPIAGRYAIYHNGHTGSAPQWGFPWDGATTIDWLLSRGWQVFAMDMPLLGLNAADKTPTLRTHEDLARFDNGVQSPLSLFFLPIKAAVDMVTIDAGYPDPTILMIGISGGGWSTYFYSALDSRIDVAVPVAGGLPMSMRVARQPDSVFRDFGDYEQHVPHLGVTTQENLMTTAGSLGSLFIYNRNDPCCFAIDPESPNDAAFIAYLESASHSLHKTIRVFVDSTNMDHSIGHAAFDAVDDFLNELVPPIVVAVNNKQQYTSVPTVTITISATDATSIAEVSLSNNGQYWSNWEPYTLTTFAWTLASGEDGIKTIYARLQDDQGNPWNSTRVFTDSIFLDTEAPIGGLMVGVRYTNAPTATVAFTATDVGSGVAFMRLSERPDWAGVEWEPYTPAPVWAFSAGDGEKVLYAQVNDWAGNPSPVYSVGVGVDTEAPTGGLTVLGSNPSNKDVQLEFEANDTFSGVDAMLVADVAHWYDAKWLPYVNLLAWPPAFGQNIVMGQYRDKAGNASDIYSVNILWGNLIFLPLVAKGPS